MQSPALRHREACGAVSTCHLSHVHGYLFMTCFHKRRAHRTSLPGLSRSIKRSISLQKHSLQTGRWRGSLSVGAELWGSQSNGDEKAPKWHPSRRQRTIWPHSGRGTCLLQWLVCAEATGQQTGSQTRVLITALLRGRGQATLLLFLLLPFVCGP